MKKRRRKPASRHQARVQAKGLATGATSLLDKIAAGIASNWKGVTEGVKK